jgi:hypothetical protein
LISLVMDSEPFNRGMQQEPLEEIMRRIHKPQGKTTRKNQRGMTETEYFRNLGLIRGQVNIAIESFYFERLINQIASEQPAVLEKINRDAAFWNFLLYSLQSTFFMALGRIFDTDSKALSIYRFLSLTVEHPEYFSKEALRARKIRLLHATPDWLDKFIEEAWEPTKSDLRDLKKKTGSFSEKVMERYRPIRNEIFGHNIAMDDKHISESFGKTQINEIAEILYFLFDLTEVISELFLNGRKPELRKVEYDYRQRIRNCVQTVLFDLAKILPEEKSK